ncbi:MAG: hypothetical protein K8W52_45545 [Deltaproteobacteria bacterium]|nr:hypothetical protein [Deltaproteobacteria bacterium]
MEDLDAVIASVRGLTKAPADDLAALCFFLERLVWGPDRIEAILPEREYLEHPRPADTAPAWERMGVPVRCRTIGKHELVLWPWLDLTRGRERTELLLFRSKRERTLWATPAIRARYRDKIRTGFFGV